MEDSGLRYHPWRELRAADDLIYQEVDLPSGDAWWSPRRRVVLMRPGLRQVQRRCALAHELGHRHLGHSGQCHYNDSGRQSQRAELAADHWAARRLITVEQLVEALLWTDDPDEAADELWVTRRILDVRLEYIHPAEWTRVRQQVLDRKGAAGETVHDGHGDGAHVDGGGWVQPGVRA